MDESKVGERVICTSRNRIAVAHFGDAGAVYCDVSVSYTKGQIGDQEEGGELAMTGEGAQIGFGSDSPAGGSHDGSRLSLEPQVCKISLEHC